MDSVWFVSYLVLLAVAFCQSAALLLQTWENRRYARSCMGSAHRFHPTGHVAVIAPCKGLDVDLAGNLRGLMRQDYDDYEVIFVVQSEDDPACGVIRQVLAEETGVPARIVVAGPAVSCSQKVHNLRVATADLPEWVEYLAFVDSDARPGPQWVRMLIRQLRFSQVGRPQVGAVTGFRWMTPVRDSLANHLAYSINGRVMSLLGRSSHYLVWGGSWAIRRERFDEIGLWQAWGGMLADDLTATRVLRRHRLTVRFEPACVVASPTDFQPAEMFFFLRRQYLMTLGSLPGWWAFALAASTFGCLLWAAHLAAFASALATGSPPLWLPLTAGGALYLLTALRGTIREDLLRTYFPDDRQAMRKAKRFDVWMDPLIGLANWVGMLASVVGRRVTWRGIVYRVSAGGRVRSIRHGDEASADFDGVDHRGRDAVPTRSRSMRCPSRPVAR